MTKLKRMLTALNDIRNNKWGHESSNIRQCELRDRIMHPESLSALCTITEMRSLRSGMVSTRYGWIQHIWTSPKQQRSSGRYLAPFKRNGRQLSDSVEATTVQVTDEVEGGIAKINSMFGDVESRLSEQLNRSDGTVQTTADQVARRFIRESS